MHVVADTTTLVADKVIDEAQAREIQSRSRQAMVALAVNSILFLGILSASGGLIFWLNDPEAVAVFGLLAVGAGVAVLRSGTQTLRMFGNATLLIGAGMLAGGATIELFSTYPEIAGQVLATGGGVLALGMARVFERDWLHAPFVTGTICVIGVALHLGGLGYLLGDYGVTGLPVSAYYFYAAGVLVLLGWFVDVRLISALAIVPFGQMLDAGTVYFHAAYVFYSPEPALSIVQMSVLVAACLWVAQGARERTARHARILSVLAFVVANLCALVGSLWGDVVGDYIWGPAGVPYWELDDWEAHRKAVELFKANALVIPDRVFAIGWAAALVAILLWASHRNNRGLFNTALVFGVIHAYTQVFESFGDEPLAYVIGGFGLIPVAWGMWRIDGVLKDRADHGGLEAAHAPGPWWG